MDIYKLLTEKPVEIFAAIIAFIAFYLPWRTAYGKYVSVEWSNELKKVPISQLQLGKAKYLHKSQNGFAYICSVSITNPSNVAIGYFNFAAIDPKYHVKNMIMMKAAVEVKFQNEMLLLNIPGNGSHILNMPPNEFGTFPPNSFTKFDIVITAAPNFQIADNIQIVFRVTYKTFSSRFFSLIATIKSKEKTTFYHTFSKIYKLPE